MPNRDQFWQELNEEITRRGEEDRFRVLRYSIQNADVWWRAEAPEPSFPGAGGGEATQYAQIKEEPMTRQEFMKIAEVLKTQRPDPKHATIGEQRVWALLVRAFATMLAADHPRFDQTVFYDAAGYAGEGL